MDITVLLFSSLKSGEISLVTKGKKSLNLKVENKNIDIDLFDKKLMKDLINVVLREKTLWEGLRSLKRIGDNLKSEGLTVAVSYDGSTVIKLGSEASSSLLGDAIEIKDLSCYDWF